MKKLFLTLIVAVLLSVSALTMPVQANDGDGHDAGYTCTVTPTNSCPPPANQPGAASATSTGNGGSSATGLGFLGYVLSLLP